MKTRTIMLGGYLAALVATVAVGVFARAALAACINGDLGSRCHKIGRAASSFNCSDSIWCASLSSSVTPERGQPATHTRASAAAKCVDGVVSDVATGVPVLSQPLPLSTGTTCSGPVGYVSNRNTAYTALRNQTIDDVTSWTATSVAVAANSSTTDPGLTTTADEVNDTDAGAAGNVNAAVACAAANRCYASFWFRSATNGTPTPVFEIDGTQKTCAQASTTWQRCTVEDASASGSSVTLRIYPAGTAAGNTGSILVWRPEVWNASTVSGSLPVDVHVTTAAVTVAIDSLTYGALSNYTSDASDITACAWVHLSGPLGNNGRILSADTGPGTDFSIFVNNSTKLGVVSVNVNTEASSNTLNAGAWNFVCGGVDAGVSAKLYTNGTLTTIADLDGSGPATTETIRVGMLNTSAPFNGVIRWARIWDRSLSEAEMDAFYDAEKGTHGL